MDAWVVAPLAVLALATGVAQAVLGGWNLATHWWVTIKLATTAATAAAVIVVLEPRLAASAQAAITGQAFTAADFLPLAVAPAVAVALLIGNVALGIAKPRRRLPFPHRQGAVVTRTDPHHAHATTGTNRIVAAPTTTLVAAAGTALGVLAQAALAGGFLAGRTALRDLHGYVGYTLLATAAVALVAGLLGRQTRPEALAELGTRAALVLTVAATIFAGMRAGRGTADLLIVHIPLAFAVAALAIRLILVTRPRPHTRRCRSEQPEGRPLPPPAASRPSQHGEVEP